MWEQLEFDFTTDVNAKSNKKKYVDYEALYQRLKQGPTTFEEIQKLAGLTKAQAAQCITTLSLKYPVWSPDKGVYKLCDASDYSTVNWSKLYD